ncbi:MAG TPA: hypothetical protein VMU84_20165 [Thermoanaerobaculia bacterium]|nr:hypothetical protein [Thermoanaerobaculia bacterium]
MPAVKFRSRIGNVVLGIVGAAYLVFALTLLTWYLADAWDASGMLDRLMQLMLLGAAIAGAWFVRIAQANLGPGGWHHFFGPHASHPDRRVVR